MSHMSQVTTLCIPQSHPALPGHFPGHPVVPAVVLLDRVLTAAEDWLQRPMHVRMLKQAKFLAPLLPQQQAAMELLLADHELRFAVKREDQLIAQGAFDLASEAAA